MSSKKIAFITGASRGIGKSIALSFAKNCYSVGLLARDEKNLSQISKSIEQTASQVAYAPCDLLSSAQTEHAITELVKQLGTPSVLIHNAGLVLRKPLEDTSMLECEELLRLNLLAPIQICKQLLPLMKKAGGGSIIFISSVSGRLPLPGGSIYAASKHGLTGFADSLLGEFREHNIRITTIFPGSVKRDDEGADCEWKLNPEDVARSCLFAAEQPQECCVHHLEVRPLKPNK